MKDAVCHIAVNRRFLILLSHCSLTISILCDVYDLRCHFLDTVDYFFHLKYLNVIHEVKSVTTNYQLVLFYNFLYISTKTSTLITNFDDELQKLKKIVAL